MNDALLRQDSDPGLDADPRPRHNLPQQYSQEQRGNRPPVSRQKICRASSRTQWLLGDWIDEDWANLLLAVIDKKKIDAIEEVLA